MKNLILLLSVLTITSTICVQDDTAAKFIASAKIVKGDVTYLLPGARKAKKLVKGVKLYKDTSIYVKGKGFARIKYINASTVIVGPNSKIILEMDLKDKTSLVNLMTGKIRAMVDKNKKNDKKFLVRTSSATMGVRGTEFQVSFAPKAKKTSLLTFDGRVDMKKTPKLTETSMSNTSAGDRVTKIKSMLKDNPTSVKKGDFLKIAQSDTVKNEKVKINPNQFVLMKKDDSLGAKKVVLSNSEKKELNKEAKELEKDFNKELAATADGEVKSMGYVDFDKGVYIPPVDAEKKKFLGKIGTDGSYIPPKGVEVDEEKGIVLKAKASQEIKDFVDKTNKNNQVPAAILKSNQNAYERYFDV